MGGEYFPEKKLFQVCSNKKNRVNYSHWDWDHINFSSKVKRILPSLCRVSSRLPLNKRKKRMIQKIPPCSTDNPLSIYEVPFPKTVQPKNSNESSRVFIVKRKILIPGDSTARMEKHWSSFLLGIPIKILITGHHGSRSSTSYVLLDVLPQLQLAISSARRKRYGHPHPSTVQKLRKKGILFINVEDFGHIRVILKHVFPKAIPF